MRMGQQAESQPRPGPPGSRRAEAGGSSWSSGCPAPAGNRMVRYKKNRCAAYPGVIGHLPDGLRCGGTSVWTMPWDRSCITEEK